MVVVSVHRNAALQMPPITRDLMLQVLHSVTRHVTASGAADNRLRGPPTQAVQEAAHNYNHAVGGEAEADPEFRQAPPSPVLCTTGQYPAVRMWRAPLDLIAR